MNRTRLISILLFLCVIIAFISGCSGKTSNHEPRVFSTNLVRSEDAWIKADDKDPEFVYSGTWEVKSDSGSFKGSTHYTEESGSKIIFNFIGSRFKVYGSKGMNMGRFTVYIGTKKIGEFNAKSEKEESSVLLFDSGELEPDSYSVFIIFRKDEGTSQAGIIDAIEYNNPLAEKFFVNIDTSYNLADVMEDRTFESTKTGISMKYRLYVPPNYNSSKKYALVTYLHGIGERGSDNLSQINVNNLLLYRLISENEKYPCIILVPQCPLLNYWSDTDVEPVAIELIDKLTEEYSIDKKKLIITGFSMGGYGAWSMIINNPGKFSAAVPVSGGASPENSGKIKSTRIWAFHGAEDTIVIPESSREISKALYESGYDIKYSEYPGIGHECDTAYREKELLEWMFK